MEKDNTFKVEETSSVYSEIKSQCSAETATVPNLQKSNGDDNVTTKTTVEAVCNITYDSMKPKIAHSKFRLNILILGTIGSGKATLANKIANEDIFKPKDDITRRPEIRPGRSEFSNFSFLLIDTFGVFHVKDHQNLYSYHNFQQIFEENMRDGVNLIIVTIRKGCSSPEEIKVLNYIITERFSKSVVEHVALIITACEEVGYTKKDEFLKNLRMTTEDTKYLFDYALRQKGVHITAFPNIDEVDDDDSKASFKKKIEVSEEGLKQLLKNCKTQLFFKEIFGDLKEKEEKNWIFLPSKEIGSVCTQS